MKTEEEKWPPNEKCVAARELYVEELIDRHIERSERKIRGLRLLKGGMSQDFLRSPASNINSILEL